LNKTHLSPETVGVPEETLVALDKSYREGMTSDEAYRYMTKMDTPTVTPLLSLGKIAEEEEADSGISVKVTPPKGSDIWKKYPTAEAVNVSGVVYLHPALKYRNRNYILDAIEHSTNEVRRGRGEAVVREPRIIRVKSWRDIPADNTGAGVKAMTIGNKIYVTEQATKDSLEHELYHFRKRHASVPRTPQGFVDKERDAIFHSYKVTGSPKGIRRVIYALLTDLEKEYNITHDRGMAIIRSSFRGLDIPTKWQTNIKELYKEAQEWGKGQKKRETTPDTVSNAAEGGTWVDAKAEETVVRRHTRQKPSGGDTIVRRHTRRLH